MSFLKKLFSSILHESRMLTTIVITVSAPYVALLHPDIFSVPKTKRDIVSSHWQRSKHHLCPPVLINCYMTVSQMHMYRSQAHGSQINQFPSWSLHF